MDQDGVTLLGEAGAGETGDGAKNKYPIIIIGIPAASTNASKIKM